MAKPKSVTDEELRLALEHSDIENYAFRESEREDEDFVAGNLTKTEPEQMVINCTVIPCTISMN